MRLIFGVFPGGGNDQFGYVAPPSWERVIGELEALRGEGAYDVHIYTAWSWHTDAFLDSQIALFTGAGYNVTLTIKYSPPPERVGDVGGYVDFCPSYCLALRIKSTCPPLRYSERDQCST